MQINKHLSIEAQTRSEMCRTTKERQESFKTQLLHLLELPKLFNMRSFFQQDASLFKMKILQIFRNNLKHKMHTITLVILLL